MNMSDISVEEMTPGDWPSVSRIYLEGIRTGNATFETNSPEWESWDKSHRSDCRLVARCNGEVVGWAALSNVSQRKVYSGVCEVSIYICSGFRGKGIGGQLMERLIAASEKHRIWTLQAGIFPENTGSLVLHEKMGFRQVGIREKIGQMNGVWRDVIFLERRSKTVF